jgi:hypothetical protein
MEEEVSSPSETGYLRIIEVIDGPSSHIERLMRECSGRINIRRVYAQAEPRKKIISIGLLAYDLLRGKEDRE